MDEDADRVRFASVVLPHLTDAFTLACWLSGSRADAEDITQEACLRAFRAIETFRGEQARAWVLTIVRNTAHSWLAKNRNFKWVSVDELHAEDRKEMEFGGSLTEATASTPESKLIAQVEASDLERAIADLPEIFREVVVLRDVQGLSYQEIGMVAGVAIGTVMSRLSRGRRRVLERLNQGSADDVRASEARGCARPGACLLGR
jgi:RNA polymerase sigma-70 factor (ECF subfamily)